MVPHAQRWHLATKRSPEREERLLAFAGNTPGTSRSADSDDQASPLNPALGGVVVPTPDNIEALQGQLQPRATGEDTANIQQDMHRAAAHALDREGEVSGHGEIPHIMTPEEALIDGVKNLRNNAAGLLAILSNQENHEKIQRWGSEKMQKQWKEDEEEVTEQRHRAAGDGLFVQGVQRLREGGNPNEFIEYFHQWTKGEGYGFDEYFDRIKNVIQQVWEVRAKDIDQWDTLNETTKIEIRTELLESGAVRELIAKMTLMHSALNAAIEKSHKEYEALALKLKNESAGMETPSIAETLAQIRWYSLNDIFHGAKEYWEALKHSWEHTRHTKSAAVANAIGDALRWLPFYGEETALQLNQNIRSKNRETTGKEKERLKESQADWVQLFGKDKHGGLLHEYLHGSNYDNARAVLEYAASRGWLYDLDDSLSTDTKTVFGYSLGKICTDWSAKEVENYYTSLRQQNAGGRDDEIANAKKKIHDNREVPIFINEIEKEMDAYNIWAAAGICERAMERGLWGEVSPWLTTTVLGKLRENPMLRSLTNDFFFDKVGKMSMYTTAPTLGWLKADGRDLTKWCAQDKAEYFAETKIGKIMITLEEEAVGLSGEPRENFETQEGRKRMRQWTAKILAGQTVQIGSGYASIFESKYGWYRKEMAKTFASPAKPYEEDSDYYICHSEQWLTPENVFKKILAHQSTGEFHREDLVKPFITKLIDKAKELRGNPQLGEAYENYMSETRAKLDLWAIGLKEHNAGARISTTVLSDNQTPAIAALYYNGLISKNVLQSVPSIWNIISGKQMENNPLFPWDKNSIYPPQPHNPPTP